MKTVDTINDHLRSGYRLFGWCHKHGFRDIDLQELVRRGLGERSLKTLPRLVCARCRRPLEIRRAPPTGYDTPEQR